MAAMRISKGFAKEEVAMTEASLDVGRDKMEVTISRDDEASAVDDEDPKFSPVGNG